MNSSLYRWTLVGQITAAILLLSVSCSAPIKKCMPCPSVKNQAVVQSWMEGVWLNESEDISLKVECSIQDEYQFWYSGNGVARLPEVFLVSPDYPRVTYFDYEIIFKFPDSREDALYLEWVKGDGDGYGRDVEIFFKKRAK